MMMLAVRRALLGELDLVGPVEMVDLSYHLSVRGYNVHMFPDLQRMRHLKLRNSLHRKRGMRRKVATSTGRARIWPVSCEGCCRYLRRVMPSWRAASKVEKFFTPEARKAGPRP